MMTAAALILVVDDDAEVRDIAAATLKDAGHRILEAANGGDALTVLEANPGIQLIFTDIVMPGIDGFKLADLAVERRPEIKILFTTGYSHLAEAKPGTVHGKMLQKPYRPAQLQDMVQHVLAGAVP
jgi:CheY-like chemotaxis protein